MLLNSNKTLNEIDLDQQLAETQNLKQCILEFSTRLQLAQERLLEEKVSKKIKDDLVSTQKAPTHQRRYNSCHIPKDIKRTTSPTIEDTENAYNHQERHARKSDCFAVTGHIRKASEFIENPAEKFESFSLPILPSVAFRHFKYVLTTFEQSEILEFNEIYYLGLGSDKIKSYSRSLNYGFDDERGDYKIVTNDHIAYRYQILESLGKGSFGQVVKVLDHKTKENFALKIIRNKARFHEQAQLEIKMLRSLNENDKAKKYNVVKMTESLIFRSHTCIVFELLGSSLFDALKLNHFRGINIRYIRRYCFQMFQTLFLLTKMKIIHCDLKPENVLLSIDNKSSIKIVDFGSSCYKSSRVFTYIQSRFYRAPEIIFGFEYTEAIDIWSLGCIMLELYTGLPIFPGENEVDLFNCMIEVLGVPPISFIAKCPKKSMFFNSKNEPRIVINSKGKKRTPGDKPLFRILADAPPALLDIIMRCLQWEPESRITPRQALEHEWFQSKKQLLKVDQSKGHRYHMSDTQFNYSSYNKIFNKSQTIKCNGFAI